MLVSEAEARNKWCPHARELGFLKDAGNIHRRIAGYNRNEEGLIPACIASSCMAWRWASKKKLKDIDLVTGDVEKYEHLGYCGLSGKPEYGE